jgi:ubiquinone/menaquinone biosynthesis C-methylase UbiE
LKGLPFKNHRFDYIPMAFLEHAISELKWPAVLAEVVRILRPGGTLEVITEEFIFPNHADWDIYTVQKHLEDDFTRLLRRRRLLGVMEKMGELL